MAPVFFLLLAAVSVVAAPEDKDLVQYRHEEDKSFIVGGVPANIEEFPFMVSLLFVNESEVQHYCGGTILTEDWVLTAAHCVDQQGENKIPIDIVVQSTVFRAGSRFRAGSSFDDREGTTRRCTEAVFYEFPPHDIALMKVDDPWPLNGITISRARLTREDDPVPPYSPATIVGWGWTDDLHKPSDVLMKQEVVVISHGYCKAAWLFWSENLITINDTHMCTLYNITKTPSSAFPGDSGGPLVVNGQVVGVASLASHETACIPVVPNVYTRVSSFIDWIEDTVGPLPSAK